MRVLVAVVAALCPSLAHATEAGLDVGHVVDAGDVHPVFDQVASTGVDWVRINMRLDAWSAPDDATPHGPDGLTYFEAYDRAIDAYVARGISVYALINDESVAEAGLDHNSDAWIALYVQNAVEIVDHFKNRVRTFEIINEPNDYAGGSSARFTPHAFAKILQDTYLAVKHDAGHTGDRCWQVDLISGPLFSFDGNDSASYLDQAYALGSSELAWDYTHQVTGSYPLDGIGYHMYVAQGADSATSDVGTAMAANLGALDAVIASHEGATTKRVWVSEYGWRADAVGDAGQSDRMQAGFSAMTVAGDVTLAVYFDYQDFPGNEWGVFDAGGTRRPSADMLAALAAANRPARSAIVTNVAVPTLAPGETGEVIVTLTNRGSATWTDGWRLGAGAGCPDAAETNAIAWAPAAGYANSPTDARVYLPADVPPGASIDVHVPVVAPGDEGTYTFAARMVDEGVSWFGPTATAQVVVAQQAGSGSDAGSGSEPGPRAGGCSTGGAPGWLLVVVIVGFGHSLGRSRHRT